MKIFTLGRFQNFWNMLEARVVHEQFKSLHANRTLADVLVPVPRCAPG